MQATAKGNVIAEAYFSGLTNGTSATTYNPGDAVPREQMAAFITRTLEQSLRRRVALNQWWTPAEFPSSAQTIVNTLPQLVASDDVDFWVVCDTLDVTGTPAPGTLARF